MSKALWQVASRLSLAFVAAIFLGLATGHHAFAFALVLAPYLGVQIWNLVRLEHWLRRRRVESTPDISGPWGEVVAIIDRLYRRKQYHKQRVVQLLREFRRLTSAMPEGAILLGPGNEILWFNRRAAGWLGLKRKRDFGIRIENLVRHPLFVEYLQRQDTSTGVVIHQPLQGDLWLSFHLVWTKESARKLLVARDVSREVRLESMRKNFVANASHELRSPLTVVMGYLDALADDQTVDAQWRPPIMEMRRQAERMHLILSDLLELSKLESSTPSMREQSVDIGGVLALTRKEVLASTNEPRNITLSLDSDSRLRGTESEVHSIVSNLVSNALKYTTRNGRIDLRWWTDHDGGHLEVKDDGIGIAAEHIPRLTERFYRVDSGRARETGGSGLGLSIVKHALLRHQGTLAIKSVEGQGSTFTCHFPPHRVDVSAATESQQTLRA